ncbi:MAG: dTDP-4-amino-4,6-dideoxygalactose transaminase, partial [Myxococcota bacterium]
VREFEEAVERRLDVPHAIAISSCTSGLMLGARALGLRGEVIMPPFTWTSTGLAMLWQNITPVFADVLDGTYTLDPAAFEAAITPETTAVMPVTVFGVPPNIAEIEAIARRHDLKVFYDSAQALGSTYKGVPIGGFGDLEVFSMSPTKVATAMEGGILTTRNDELATLLRRMRDYGKADDGDIDICGLSARQTEFHGVVAKHTLAHLDEYVAARAGIAARYRAALESLVGVGFQTQPSDRTTSWNYFTMFIDGGKLGRDELQAALLERGIQTKRYFYPSLHEQTIYSHLRERSVGKLPVAERASGQGLALPLFSHMSSAQVERVIDAVRSLMT